MKNACSAIAILLLSACAMPDRLKSDAISYDGVLEDTVDKLLVVNILRARDQAPLHFSDIPSIHDSLQTTASVTPTIPFGTSPGPSTTRKSIAGTVSIQSSPTFDLSHLDTKDFVTGIASPIDQKFVKYWLDRGLEPRIVLLLFFASIDISDTNSHKFIRVYNAPRPAISFARFYPRKKGDSCSPNQPDFSRYLTMINELPHLFANSYTERRIVSKQSNLDGRALAQILALDTEKFSLEFQPPSTYTLYQLSPKITLCSGSLSLSSQSKDACTKSKIDKGDKVSASDSGQIYVYPTIKELAAFPIRQQDAQVAQAQAIESEEYCRIYEGALAFLGRKYSGGEQNIHDKNAGSSIEDPYQLAFNIRSVGEMIHFLGDLLAYQRDVRKTETLNNPVTLGWCSKMTKDGAIVKEEQDCNEHGALFEVNKEAGTTHISGIYRQEPFAIADFSEDDHSVEVLSVLHQLIDLNKSATDLRATPVVQVVP